MKGQINGMLELLITAIVVIPIILLLLNVISSTFTNQQCQPYISQIAQKDAQISGLNTQNQQLNDNLQQCRNEYNRLTTENITKKDIEDIKQDLNTTQTNVNILNQRFDEINNSYMTVYHNLYFYFGLSVVINVFLFFSVVVFIFGDIVSASIFKFDIKQQTFSWVISKLIKVKGWVQKHLKDKDEHAGV